VFSVDSTGRSSLGKGMVAAREPQLNMKLI
jgi:hypothetical protein